MLAAPAAPLGRRIADARADQALHFQAIEGDVDGANRQLPSRPRLNLAPDRRAVRLRPQPDQRQQDELFEFAQYGLGFRYLLHNVKYITGRDSVVPNVSSRIAAITYANDHELF